MKKVAIFLSLIFCIVLVSVPAFGDGFQKSKGQAVYATMNHNCFEPYEPDFPIPWWECTWSVNTRLIIRNVDSDHSITISKMYFHGPDGELIYEVLETWGYGPQEIPKLASITFALPHWAYDYWSAVYVGRPSLIVEWTAKSAVHPPIISSGHVIVNRAPESGVNSSKIEGLTATPGVVLRNIPGKD